MQLDLHSHCSGVSDITLVNSHVVIVSLFLNLNVFNMPAATKSITKFTQSFIKKHSFLIHPGKNSFMTNS